LPTIDAPPIRVDPKYKNINISLPELKRRVCSRAYGRTLVALGEHVPSFSENADDNIQVELQTVERTAGVSESAAEAYTHFIDQVRQAVEARILVEVTP
jgi:hypothetical protein